MFENGRTEWKWFILFAHTFYSMTFGEIALAESITLKSESNAFVLTGELISYDGEYYTLDTKYGPLTVDGSRVSCESENCPSTSNFVAEVQLSGASDIGNNLMPGLVEGFARSLGLYAQRIDEDDTHFEYILSKPIEGIPVGRFQFRASTTDEGFADLLANEADVVMATRKAQAEELMRVVEVGLGRLDEAYRSYVLALDAFTVISSPSNPISKITIPDLAGVLTGEIVNWNELGGAHEPIEVHMYEEQSEISQAVEDWLQKSSFAPLSKHIIRHPNHSHLIQEVESNRYALGVISYSLDKSKAHLGLIEPCGLEIQADHLTIKSEDYPLTAPFFLYTPARRLPKLARDFLVFTRTQDAQEIIRRAGYVDQKPQVVTDIIRDAQIKRTAETALRTFNIMSMDQAFKQIILLSRVIKELRASHRVSTSFRFEVGASTLDAHSISTVYQLAEAVKAGDFDGKKLTFIGFTDGQGALEYNLRIARYRAQRVKQAVEVAVGEEALSRVQISIDAFGPALPIACDDFAWGRRANRRVELWIQ